MVSGPLWSWLSAKEGPGRQFDFGDYDLVFLFRPEARTNRLIYPLAEGSLDDTSSSGTRLYNGPDLNEVFQEWVQQEFSGEIQVVTGDLSGAVANSERAIAVTWISGTPPQAAWFSYFWRILRSAWKMRRRGLRVISVLPDSYIAEAALTASAISSLTGGWTFFLQSTAREASDYGYPYPVAPVFWTWPQARVEKYLPIQPWIERRNTCLVPSGSEPTSRREREMLSLETALKHSGVETIRTDGSLTKSEYQGLMRNSKFCATTNWVQEGFISNWRPYARKMPPTTTTGRVWEAFAAGCVLITNPTEVITEMGFKVDEHYLDLDIVISGRNRISDLSAEQLADIALRGHQLFLKQALR